MLSRFAPKDVIDILTGAMQSLSNQNSGGILTFAFVVTIWSSSGAMVSIITTLNAAYDVTESRPWWKTRLIAIALTVGIAFFILISMFLVIAGPTLAENIAARMHLGPAFKWTWWVLQWPVVFALVASAIGLVYYFAPDVEQDWVWITPGSVLATGLWLAVSVALKLYYTSCPTQRRLRDHRRNHGPDAVVLPLGDRAPARRGDERGDRARFPVREGPGRAGAGREESGRRPRPAPLRGEARKR